MTQSKYSRTSLDDLAMLRAGVRFATKVGRPPKRLDFREPQKSAWESNLGLVLPTSKQASYRFGGWTAYLKRMGYDANESVTNSIGEIEQAAIAHCEDIWPELEVVDSEQNSYDAYLPVLDTKTGLTDPKRVEIKGASLSGRSSDPNALYFSFKTHGRKLSQTVDMAVFVGMGRNPETGLVEPILRMEFPKQTLMFIDDKSTIMLYASSAFAGGHSQYNPYIRWKRHLSPANIRDWKVNKG